MTIVLTVLLAVLKFVGWLLLFLLALLVVLLILPVELRFAYQAGKPSLTAWYGPLHFTLWPRAAAKDTAAQHPAAPQPAPAAQPSAEPAPSKTQPAPAAAPTGAAAPAAQSPQASVAAKAAPTPPPLLNLPESIQNPALCHSIFRSVSRPPSTCSLMILPPLSAVCSGTCAGSAVSGTAHQSAAPYRILDRHRRGCGPDRRALWRCHGRRQQSAGVFAAGRLPAMRPYAAGVGFHRPTQGRASHFRGRLHTHPFLLLWLLIRLLFRLGKDPQLQPAHTN